MVVYWNILVWSFFAASLWRLSPRKISLENGAYEKKANLFMAVLAFSIIIFFAGLRSGIADTDAYINIFINMPESFLEDLWSEVNKDKGFYLFTYFMKYFISDDFHVWLFTIALISGLAVMIPLYKYSPMFELSTFLFVATAQFTWLLNGMRQFIAISILFLSLDLIIKKRFKTYLLIVLILSTIHGSAFFMLPFYFLCQSKPWSLKMLITVVFFSIAFLFMGNFLSLGAVFLEETQYAGYTDAIAEIAGSSIFRVIAAAIPLLLTLWRKKEVLRLNDNLLNLCINMSTLNFCFMLLATSMGGLFIGRVAAYFDIYNLLLYPLVLTKLFEGQVRSILYVGIVLGFIAWFYYQMVVAWDMYYVSDVLDLYTFLITSEENIL